MKHELIGKKIEVVESRNKDVIGLEGNILDESKHTFMISTKKGTRKILKQGTKFMIDDVVIDGDKINRRPEERIK